MSLRTSKVEEREPAVGPSSSPSASPLGRFSLIALYATKNSNNSFGLILKGI